jgi:hypothetical protein
MRYRILTFLRLIWGEWSSRVTGSASALLILLGFGISIAGITGTKIPYDSTIQLATWVLALICGGQAAYATWARERNAREIAENAAAKLQELGISVIGISDYDFDAFLHVAEIEVRNDSIRELGNCLAVVTDIFRDGSKEPIRELPLALRTALNRKRNGGGPFYLRPGQTKKIPVCGVRNDETMLRVLTEQNSLGLRNARGCSFVIHVDAYGAQKPTSAKVVITINEQGEMAAGLMR